MIQARPATAMSITADGFAPGLVGTIGHTLLDLAGDVAQARTTTGIHEVDSLGVYVGGLTTPDEPGVYVIVWDDADEQSAAEELVVSATPAAPVGQSTPADWTPSVAEVGKKMRARTVDASGNELGTFTDDTRPTADEVTDAIVEEVGALASYVGTDLPAVLWPLARSAALARVAARLELDYWPEQVRSDRSAYTELAADRDREEGRLISAVRAAVGTGEGGGRAVGSLRFRPEAAIGHDLSLLPVGNSPEWPFGGGAGTPV